MKQTIITGLVVLIIIGLLSVMVLGSKNKNVQFNIIQSNQEGSLTPKPTSNNNSLIFYYGNTCPHCKEIEEWIKDNKIEEKIDMIKKEVYDNHENAQELSLAAQNCKLDTNNIGVPFLYAENKCYVGKPDIVSYLSQKAGL